MKKLILITLLLIVIGCNKQQRNISDYQIELIFEHNGIKMYRFYDNNEYHYFSGTEPITTIELETLDYEKIVSNAPILDTLNIE